MYVDCRLSLSRRAKYMEILKYEQTKMKKKKYVNQFFLFSLFLVTLRNLPKRYKNRVQFNNCSSYPKLETGYF